MATSTDKDKRLTENSGSGMAPKKYNCTRLFLGLLLSPNNGWRKMRNAKVIPADFEQQVFYPLLALTAVCQFLILFYQPTTPISSVLQSAIVGFVAVFAGYFAALAAAHVFLPPKASEKSGSPFFRVFIAASMATLDTGFLLSLIAPQMKVILWLGLIYSLYVACRGVKYLHVPHNERVATSILVCVMVCGLPAAVYALFTLLMPTV